VIVAAGAFDINGSTVFSVGNLAAKALPQAVFHLTFGEFKPDAHFVVKGTAVASISDALVHVFEVMQPDAELAKFLLANNIPPNTGIAIRIISSVGLDSRPTAFEVEISRF
jgi:hypothetical protein